MGDPEPRRVIDNASFSAAQKQQMLSTTAQKVFRVRLPRR
jgi:hypothetical protein